MKNKDLGHMRNSSLPELTKLVTKKLDYVKSPSLGAWENQSPPILGEREQGLEQIAEYEKNYSSVLSTLNL